MNFLPGCPEGMWICDPFGHVRTGLFSLLLTAMPEPFPTFIMTTLSVAMVTTIIALIVMAETLAERRLVGFMQGRLGPNRVGPQGLLQPIADAIKLLMKEIIIPFEADRIPYYLAPLVVLVPSLMVWSLIPWGPGLGVTDVSVALLLVVALGSLPTIGILMAGWASANKYAMLGGIRAAAQLISYELPLVIVTMIPVLLSGTMSLQGIVDAQQGAWFAFYLPAGPIAAFLFLIGGIAEANRAPFDLPEAESELIAGFHTEYSGMAWALFYLAEYANAFAVSAMTAILFWGGWLGPILPPWLWLFIKACVGFFIIIWVRGAWPRIRYDQMMRIAWKFALPLSLLLVLVTAAEVLWRRGLA